MLFTAVLQILGSTWQEIQRTHVGKEMNTDSWEDYIACLT